MPSASGHRKGGAQSAVRVCSGGMQLALSCSSGIRVHTLRKGSKEPCEREAQLFYLIFLLQA